MYVDIIPKVILSMGFGACILLFLYLTVRSLMWFGKLWAEDKNVASVYSLLLILWLGCSCIAYFSILGGKP